MNRIDWFDYFPVTELVLDSFDKDGEKTALLVYIGGGLGHDLEAFRIRYPDASGKLFLQDLLQS